MLEERLKDFRGYPGSLMEIFEAYLCVDSDN